MAESAVTTANDSGRLTEVLASSEQQIQETDSRSGNMSKRATGTVFRFTTLDDLLLEPDEDIPFVVQDLLPTGGSSILAGEPKAGKSTLARTLILSVATGHDFCGRTVVKGPVIYLALEDKRAEVQRQLKSMRGAWNGDCEPILIHVGPAPTDPSEGIELLEAAIREHKPVLVVIDVLHRFTRIGQTNDYGEVSTAMEKVNDLSRRTNCHIMALHHVGKSREKSGIDRILGSTAFAGAVDSALFYTRSSKARQLEASHLRYGTELPKTCMKLDRESGLVLPDGLVAERKDEGLKDQILGVLGKQATMTQDEVRTALGGDTAETSRVLRRLVAADDVVRSGKGVKGDPHKYSLPVPPIEDKQESIESGSLVGPSAMESPVDPSLN
ncbi:hypothetical protein B7486_07765 [cyanobacterium TDX16]|nr:hypothetical protein B7486_07765 [cyanobacterium TDX16]